MIGIYAIVSPNSRVYIGQSVDVERRFIQHKNTNRSKNHGLKQSMLKYGADGHDYEILKEFDDYDQSYITECEQGFIELYKERGFKMLNLKEAGSNGRPSEETKKKISDSLKGRPGTTMGRKLSEDHKNKIKLGAKRRKPSQEEVDALIARNKSRKGQPSGRKGMKSSPETIDRLRKMRLGVKLTPESIAKREATKKLNRDRKNGLL